MNEHTPGPWRIERRHDGVPFGVSAPETMRHDTDVLLMFANVPNIEANARLIAAAPDLLAACQAVMSVDTDEMSPEWRMVEELCRQAIDKASGEAAEKGKDAT